MAQENKKSEIAKREKEILKFWQENKIFEKSLEQTKNNKPFTFYDGPPFATGTPHYGHLLGSAVKDVVGRYWTMKGYHVPRRWGWDCHGLPIETIVEKELGISSRKEIEKIGIKEFNQIARSKVLHYVDEWRETIKRFARWVDFDGSYKTMDNAYIESVWWAFKQVYDKDLIYEGRKVLLYCPRCETSLAKAEIAMDNSYKDVTDTSVTVKFKLKPGQEIQDWGIVDENTYILAWTTTPWTLPGNVALAVGEDIEYEMWNMDGENLIVAKDKKEDVGVGGRRKVSGILLGGALDGLQYEPLFNIDKVEKSDKKAWYITTADFVSIEEGTGVVHTAVIYGEDDYRLGLEKDLPAIPLLDSRGYFNDDSLDSIKGQYFKDSEKDILDFLKKNNLVFKEILYTHSYPHCYRCETPLFYNAMEAWFVNIQKVKNEILELNKKIKWIPEHLKHGRFEHIVETAPDWNVSRSRYWASPLPIWKCHLCNALKVVGSIDDLGLKNNSNKYLVMRHGNADSNLKQYLDSGSNKDNHLTSEGEKNILARARELKNEKIDLIFSSPVLRAKESAEIISKELGLEVVYDKRLAEKDFGEYDGETIEEYSKLFSNTHEKFEKKCPHGENRNDIRVRMGEFIYEIDSKYQGKNILIISHRTPIHLLYGAAMGRDANYLVENIDYFDNSEVREVEFNILPHNDLYELDLHRPYIDIVEFNCSCGGQMKRVPEVFDCWFESGSMPFAQNHYPFENTEEFNPKEGKQFPADFIAEYIAQTRTWFYYTHTISTMLFGDVAFRNVVTTGNVLAEDGSKMSKSKQNYPDPLLIFDKYGVDALRLYLLSSPVMKGEDLNFLESGVDEVYKKVILRLQNVLSFYELFKEGEESSSDSKNVLDQWIISRLGELNEEVTKAMDEYELDRAARPFIDFINDLSTWYIRRSRDRFKGKGEDKQNALSTTRHVLQELSKLMAPFTPFIAEDLYGKVGGEKESVHLDEWLKTGSVDQDILSEMKEIRNIVSLGLEARSSAGIKVRQPLNELKVKSEKLKARDELINLIKDETNIKKVVFDKNLSLEVELDVEITPELREEGDARDLIRYIQNTRKNMGLKPGDTISLSFSSDGDTSFIDKHQEEIKSVCGLDSIKKESSLEGEEVKVGEITLTIKIK
ncbi:MAG TPA: class I tRNA ligase family protein [Candidatus Paceibacterota bacterium]|jgi:isoleucyl-tRNA synthetase|nr:isoleucine--tRNA ligase [Parcubacteria group bacterium]MDP6119596.1 class I tRNA ligase family protein [Candidatus Paceibacterota bacterium]HJN62841.1 class I tRNA ligase family protein [Candidatus Paceibacterota bacterium]|tara:strand:+ start:7035 stop:10481 length:3447 start_codon:yes stop_codon:yes gene_type:complete